MLLRKKSSKPGRALFLLSVAFFLAAFLCLCLFIKGHIVYFLNSDDSSELILAKLLADGNGLVTDKWYYSTELRVLNTQILYSFFFNLTQNWRHVRLLSFGCLYIIMLLSLLFMMDRLKIRRYYFFAAGILCIPFSGDYFEYVQKGAYYLPHIIISFLAIGLIEWIADSRKSTGKTATLICVSFVLALISGLGGARQVAVTYLPLFFSGLFLSVQSAVSVTETGSKRRHVSISFQQLPDSVWIFLFASAVSFAGSAIGYVINTKVLSKLFSFHQYNIRFSGFDINELSGIVSGFLNTLGFTDYYIFSYAAIYNVVCFACVFAVLSALIYGCGQKENERLYRYSVICSASVLIFVLLYSFTDMSYMDRYNLPIIVLFIPLCISALSICPLVRRNKFYILISFAVLMALRGGTFYAVEKKTDKTSELRAITDTLTERDYYNGYATFWNANILTELSDGKIEVWDWGDTSGDFKCIDRTYQWLQLKSHVSEHPEDKVFWVLTEDQNSTFHFPKAVSSGHVIYETAEDINWDVFEDSQKSKRYIVYGFSDYEEMYYLAGRYAYNSEFSIAPGKTGKAESTVLYPDTYTMICTGENLEAVDVCLKYKKTIKYNGNNLVWDRPHDVEGSTAENGPDYLVCTFTLNEIANDILPVFTNNGEGDAKISSVRLLKDCIYYADFWNNSWLVNGYDEEGTRHLKDNAVSYGPYITLVPGEYIVECKGENLDSVDFDCLFNDRDGLKNIELKDINRSNDSVRFAISTDRVLTNLEVRFLNKTSEEVILDRLIMKRE